MNEKQQTFLKAIGIMIVCLSIGCGTAALAIILQWSQAAIFLMAVVPVVVAMHALTPRIWRP